MTRTNTHTLLTVLVRAVAIWFLFQILFSLPGLLFLGGEFEEYAGFRLMALAGAAIVMAVLWLYADLVVRLALARPQSQVFESDLDAQAWQSVFTGAIGIWLAANAVVNLTYLAAERFYFARLAEGIDGTMPSATFADIVATLMQLAAGLALLLGARGISRWVARMRNRDVTAPPEA